ncbi:MAG: glycosyltransferase [Deltaproteobacteria bacterium]|nr:glycosyltransferase [Deltaproteobacteria bacterium]
MVLYHDHMCFASAIPEYLDIPGIQAYNTPVTPTSEFPSYVRFRHSRHTTRFSNRLSFLLRDLVTSLPYRSFVNRWRAERFGFPRIGLTGQYRALDRQKCPLLYSISPTMLPRPADWPEWVHMTGYWHLKESTEYNPPEDLISFLESGPPPVCIGFGSMRYESSETTTKIVVDAVKHCGYRAILLSGWQGMMKIDLPESIYMASEIPHSWLFEHVSASVNAGGIGTLTTALKAGLPTLAVPFGGDSLFWGWQIERLGVGPEAIHVKNLTVPLLATRLKKLVESTGYRESAQEIATAMQSEDGVATAIDFIEKTVSSA